MDYLVWHCTGEPKLSPEKAHKMRIENKASFHDVMSHLIFYWPVSAFYYRHNKLSMSRGAYLQLQSVNGDFPVF